MEDQKEINLFWNDAILNSFTYAGFEIPRSTSHLGDELIPPSVLRKSVNCSHWRLDDKFSSPRHNPNENSKLMHWFQLVSVMVVFGHHPHDLLTEWHHFVTGTLVLDLLIRCLLLYRVMITPACDTSHGSNTCLMSITMLNLS